VALVSSRSMTWAAVILGGAALAVLPIARAARRGRMSRGGRAVQRRRWPAARVLVVGDSSALGTGANAPSHSVAGRLAAAHPSWAIGNLACNGSRTSDVARMLARMARRLGRRRTGPYYDAVVIHLGGDDALRPARLGSSSVSLVLALAAANELARYALLVTGGSLALMTTLPPPWSWFVGRRGRPGRDLFQAIAWEAGVECIEPYRHSAIDAALTARMGRPGNAAPVLH